MILKLIYTIFVGIFLAIFVGVGIAAFYPSPKYPEQPVVLKYCPDLTKDASKYEEFRIQAEKFDKEEKVYQAQSQLYSRNVSIYALIAAIILVVLSLTLFRKIFLIELNKREDLRMLNRS
jgi:uncharacterized membrane protein